MRFHMLNVHQRRLHLAWKQVDAPDDEHVVRASMDLAMSGHCPPTRAGSLRECCQVSSSKPHHRQSLFGEGGKHKLTFFALGNGFPGLRVNHLNNEVVFRDVEPVLHLAFAGQARTYYLRESVVISCGHTQARFQLLANSICPGLGTEQSHSEIKLQGIHPALCGGFSDIHRVRRSADKDGGLVVTHYGQLPAGIAGGCRNHTSPHPLKTCMESKRSRGQTVSEGYLSDVMCPGSSRHSDPRAQFRPRVEVSPGVPNHYRFGRSTCGRVDAHNLFHGYREAAPFPLFRIRCSRSCGTPRLVSLPPPQVDETHVVVGDKFICGA